jgi:hypothetical protein
MARPRDVDGAGVGLEIGRVTVNVLNKLTALRPQSKTSVLRNLGLKTKCWVEY